MRFLFLILSLFSLTHISGQATRFPTSRFGLAADTALYTSTKSIQLIDTTNNITYSKQNTTFYSNNKQYVFVQGTTTTTKDISTGAIAGYNNFVTADLAPIPSDPTTIVVNVNGFDHYYLATQTASSGLTFSFSGTTISPFNGTTPINISQIKVTKLNK